MSFFTYKLDETLYMKKLFTSLCCAFTLVAAAQQNKALTVGIIVKESEFFENYPPDTLIAHLNLLNELKGVNYILLNPEDNSKADYAVRLKIFYKSSNDYRVTTDKVVNYQTEQVAIPDAGGQYRYDIITRELNEPNVVTTSSGGYSRSHLLSLDFRKTSTNRKMRYKQYLMPREEDDELNIIITLIKEIQSFSGRIHSHMAKK